MVFTACAGARSRKGANLSMNFSASAVLSSRSIPSSFLMLFSCSVRKYRRWSPEIFSSTRRPMSACSLPSSTSFFSSTSAALRRSRTSTVSRISCSAWSSALHMLAARSASFAGSWKSWNRCAKYCSVSLASGFTFSRSLIVATTSFAVAFKTSSSSFRSCEFLSGKCSTRTTIGSPRTVCVFRSRRCPSNRSVAPPPVSSSGSTFFFPPGDPASGIVLSPSSSASPMSGMRMTDCTCANVPMSCMSSEGSQFTFASSVAEPSSESPAAAAAAESPRRRRNAPTYAWPLCFISSTSAMRRSSVTRTGMITPGISGRRFRGTTSTCG